MRSCTLAHLRSIDPARWRPHPDPGARDDDRFGAKNWSWRRLLRDRRGVFDRGHLHLALYFSVRCRCPRNIRGVRGRMSIDCLFVVTTSALAQRLVRSVRSPIRWLISTRRGPATIIQDNTRMGVSNADEGQCRADCRLGLRGIFHRCGLGACHMARRSHPRPDSSINPASGHSGATIRSPRRCGRAASVVSSILQHRRRSVHHRHPRELAGPNNCRRLRGS